MDRVLEKKRWSPSRLLLPVLATVFALGLVYVVTERASRSSLTVDSARLTTAKAETGRFREYYPFDGTVEPITTVYLDVEEGGRVDEIFTQGGHFVEKDELILRFSNATLQRNSIDTETRLVENLNALRNTQLNLAQNALVLRDALLDIDYRILELEKTYERYRALIESDRTDLSREAFERARDEVAYLRDKRELLRERIAQEEILSRHQLEQADQSIERLNLSLDLLNRIVDSLEIRAPISGFLSSIDAQIGQNVNRGERLGQIDILDQYKISVRVDQFYISRVQVGTPGRFTLDGESFDVVVERIYPEVVNDAFTVDVGFSDRVPGSLRRGQRLTVEMTFGEPTTSLMVARGGFQQQSGGRWVYLIAPDRRSAHRTPIRLGRQNPQFVEVLEGLQEGDWIVSSSYQAFNEADQLHFTQPIEIVR